MVTEILELTEDELSAFRASQDSLLSPTEDGANDLGDVRADNFATYGNRDEDNIGMSDTRSLKLEINDSNTARPELFESANLDHQDTTDGTEYEGTEEYYTAEEYEVTGGEGMS
ncbi:hypothetical protein TRAPUB_8502 [Trametes pubescens]|uniref:Uncharacterized protein n=1 Tax=Trametes pubescens TaxID=154538 RepID=A0A1M2W594_TRAPU|nr:hypothetical protein TRAPUB_8502 [Trametes pubescens]